MNKNSPSMNAYTTSSSYTTFPIYDRSSGTIDPLSFYPPLINDIKSSSSFNISPTTLKKQEQEIKSQLSPTFWDRLNEATKRATSNINLYDYNAYSNYQTYGSTKPNSNKPTASFYQNEIGSNKASNVTSKVSFDTFSNRISNLNQKKSNNFSGSPAGKNRVLAINDANNARNLDRSSSKVPLIEKSQTFTNTTSKSRTNDENFLNYFKNIQIGRPNQRTQAQQSLTQPPPQISVQNKPPSPSKSILVSSKPELNQGKSFTIDEQKFTSISTKAKTLIEPNTSDKLPSTMSTINVPQLTQELVQRSKTMTLNDQEKYSKSIGVNISATNLQNKISPAVSSSKLRNFHKSLTIRSRVNNFYKDFVDEKNAYLSSLSKTGSDLNLKLSNSNLAGKESDQIVTKILDENLNEKNEEDQILNENKPENSLNCDGTFKLGIYNNYFKLEKKLDSNIILN